MKAYVFDGTPDEVVQAVTAMQAITPTAAVVIPPVDSSIDEVEDTDKIFVATDIARKVFTRRPLSEEQRKIIKILAKNSPDWTTIKVLRDEVDYTPAMFAGLLGAFGRRLTHTEGYVNGSWLIDSKWDQDEECWTYRLPKTVIEAVNLENLK